MSSFIIVGPSNAQSETIEERLESAERRYTCVFDIFVKLNETSISTAFTNIGMDPTTESSQSRISEQARDGALRDSQEYIKNVREKSVEEEIAHIEALVFDRAQLGFLNVDQSLEIVSDLNDCMRFR